MPGNVSVEQEIQACGLCFAEVVYRFLEVVM